MKLIFFNVIIIVWNFSRLIPPTRAPCGRREYDLCVSVVIWASRRALRNGEIKRICMAKKNDSYFNLKMPTNFQ